jgi:four helix bundle protein
MGFVGRYLGQRTTGPLTTDYKKREKLRDYTKIEAWKMADDLAVELYQVTKRFPKEELYGLTNQLRRSGYSVAANIAEGSARESLKDYLHFLYIARGSLTETQYFVHLARRLAYISENGHLLIAKSIKATFVRRHGLIKAVEGELGK